MYMVFWLHAAAAGGAAAAAAVLLDADPSLSCVADFDGKVPAEVAWLAGHQDLAVVLRDGSR